MPVLDYSVSYSLRMPTWNPAQYLKFAEERTRPCRDLVGSIALDAPRRAIDLGCGPGNSTQVLAGRWPDADLTGLDTSAEMLEAARRAQPGRRWVQDDVARWAADGGDGAFDLVFSNCTLQWVPEHAVVYPQLLARVAAGGALAVQIPSPGVSRRIEREMAASAAWRRWFPAGRLATWHAHEPPFYYDLLAPRAARVDLWETEYFHVMPDADAIVEWYQGTGLRPYLEAIGDPADRERFLEEYREGIRAAYPQRSDGRVLFPFRRIFAIAYR